MLINKPAVIIAKGVKAYGKLHRGKNGARKDHTGEKANTAVTGNIVYACSNCSNDALQSALNAVMQP